MASLNEFNCSGPEQKVWLRGPCLGEVSKEMPVKERSKCGPDWWNEEAPDPQMELNITLVACEYVRENKYVDY